MCFNLKAKRTSNIKCAIGTNGERVKRNLRGGGIDRNKKIHRKNIYLINSSKQRHELAEESSTQTGDVYERTLAGRKIKKRHQNTIGVNL